MQVNDMFTDIQHDYLDAVARAMVNYELKDPTVCNELGIAVQQLTAAPTWYTSDEYT
jgi:hypothetical protein